MRITEKDIADWPQKQARDAQSNLPILIRRLLHSTLNRSSIIAASFPGGDGIRKTGWDGVLEVTEGNAWVPKGNSVWEMGCDINPKQKADSDYQKRTENAPDEFRAKTTFVFVTPRDWSTKGSSGKSKSDWLDEKKQIGEWKDIRVLDAGDLEEWLETSPITSAWLGPKLGHASEGLISPEEFLDQWAGATNPNLPNSFLLRDRNSNVDFLKDWLTKQPIPLSLAAHSKEEAMAFCCAALKDNAPNSFDNLIVVKTEQALQSISVNNENAILLLENDELAQKLGRNTQRLHVIIACGQGLELGENKLVLGSYSHEGFVEEIEKLNKSNAEARKLALACGRSLSVLRRQLSINPVIKKPNWADDQNARDLIPAVLIGAWSREKEGDVQALEELAQCAYQDIERKVARLARLDSSPIEIIGNIRRVTSRVDSLFAVSPYLTEEDYALFFSIAEKTLFIRDPTIDLDEEQQWMASFYGKEHPNSGRFFRGIADTLILLSMYGDALTEWSTARSPKTRADNLVRKVLVDADGDRWKSLDGLLRFMAETSPDAFLDALENDLKKNSPAIAELFLEETSMFSSTRHANLLWALELLAWSPKYLTRVSSLFLRLMQFKLPENMGNNPQSSFVSTYLPWRPQTNATLEQRAEILDLLMQHFPDELWEVIMELISKTNSFQNSRPRWRDIDDNADVRPTRDEVRRGYQDIGKRLFKLADCNVQRLTESIRIIHHISEEEHDRLWDCIENCIENLKDDKELNILRKGLRAHLYNIRLRSDGNEESENQLSRPALLYEKAKPKDLALRHKWLFDSPWIDLPEGRDEDHERYEEKCLAQRKAALQEIFSADRADGLFKLGELIDDPISLGNTLSACDIQEFDKLSFALQIIDSGFGKRRIFDLLKGLIGFKDDEISRCFSDDMIDELKKRRDIEGLMLFMQCMPMNERTWSIVQEEGEDFHKSYWRDVPLYYYSDWTENEAQFAIDRLIEAKRPRSALRWIYHHQKKLRTDQLTELLRLFALHADLETNFHLPSSRDIERIFEEFDTREDTEANELAELEYYLFSVLQHSNRGAKHLYSQISEDPNLFIQLVRYTYRRNDGKEEENPLANLPIESQQNHINNASNILLNWKRLPGVEDDGKINPEKFIKWIDAARQKCKEIGRMGVGDSSIGKMLAHSPNGKDGHWPCEPVRNLFEQEGTEEIRQAFLQGVLYSRGVTTRLIYEGGEQERKLAQKYEDLAKPLELTYPKTSAVLRNIADEYMGFAEREDIDAKLRGSEE